jgi:hypothetical protein
MRDLVNGVKSAMAKLIIADEKRLIALLVGLLFAGLFTGIFLDYGVHNDYSVFTYNNHRCCLHYPESQHLFWIGRPLGALLLNINLLFVSSIAGFKWLRLFSFGLTVLLFLAIHYQFKRETPGLARESLLTAFAIAILPAPILYVFWITNAVPGLLTAILATLAYIRVYDGYLTGDARLAKRGYALLFVTFLIYPATSYFFLLFTCWRVLTNAKILERKWFMRTAFEFVMMGMMSGVYFIFLKLTNTPTFVKIFFSDLQPRPGGAYVASLASSLEERLAPALEYVRRAAELWFQEWIGHPLVLSAIILAVFIPATLLAARRDTAPLGSGFARLAVARLLAPLFAFVVSAAPIVLATAGFVATRNSYVGSAIVALVVLTSIIGIAACLGRRRAGYIVIAVLCVVAILAGSYRLTSAAFNAHQELSYVRRALAQYSPHINGVMIYVPADNSTIVGPPISDAYDDFYFMGTNRTPIEGFPRGVLKELGLDYRNLPVSFTNAQQAVVVHVKGNIEVCMDGAGFYIPDPGKSCLIREGQVKEEQPGHTDLWITLHAPDNPVFGIAQAFDGSITPGSFWETRINEPVIFDIDYKKPMVMRTYSIHAGPYVPYRMPTAWKVFGSNDENTWDLLQEETGVKPWQVNEQRTYAIPGDKPAYRDYRVEFDKAGDDKILRIYDLNFLVAVPAGEKPAAR